MPQIEHPVALCNIMASNDYATFSALPNTSKIPNGNGIERCDSLDSIPSQSNTLVPDLPIETNGTTRSPNTRY